MAAPKKDPNKVQSIRLYLKISPDEQSNLGGKDEVYRKIHKLLGRENK